MNEEALARTRETGDVHFFSRSRQELWHKGETSGNFLRVKALRFDCDLDAVLALVEPAGPACHTGERTCFHNGAAEPPAPDEALPAARANDRRSAAEPSPRTRATRRSCSPIRTSTATRSARRPRRSAARFPSESDQRVREEAADVLYHLTVLIAGRGIKSLADVFEELNDRRR